MKTSFDPARVRAPKRMARAMQMLPFAVGGLACFSASAQAPATATTGASLPDVIVTGNPLGSGLFQLVQPADALSGQALNARRAGTLGDTLANEPGVSATSFGPNASRPIIRGLDGDRIRILQNGAGVIDASALSFDHATAVEPMVADRIEVVRGPAALLYGANAIGGVVNAIDNRIPTEKIDGVSGRGELRAGGAERENAGVAVLEGGNGRFAVHADAYRRTTDDLRIPGYARSSRLRETDDPAREQPRGTLPNTFSRNEGGALGGSMTWDRGYLGLSLGSLRSRYGTPAEDTVAIDMRKDTVDLGGEVRGLTGLVERLKFRANHTDYEHQEKVKDTGQVNTTFRNRGYEGRIEATHRAFASSAGTLRGAFGLQFGRLDFEALGDEAFVPSTRSNSNALFVYEELARDRWKLSFGGRLESTRIDSAGDTASSGGRFGAAQRRDFSARNFSVGGLYNLTPALALAANAASTERAPTNAELFANGPHAATGSFEVGDPSAGLERSTSFDLGLRHRRGPDAWSISLFRTQFRNYLLLAPTGRSRAEDGTLEDPATPGLSTSGLDADLPEYQTRQVRALFQGLEAQGRWRLAERGGTLDFEARTDYVRATNRETGEPLPRIAPLRLSGALIWQGGPLHLRGEVIHARSQSRVASNELPTDGYTLLNAYASYRLRGGGATWELFARANNLLNAEVRQHTSLIKDIAPLGGRSLMVGIRGYF